MKANHRDTQKAEAQAVLMTGVTSIARELHQEVMQRLQVFQASEDGGRALEGAPWLGELVTALFPTNDAEAPNLAALLDRLPAEIACRLWSLPLPISERLYSKMKWRRSGGVWRERPKAEGPVFYFARGWALGEAYSLNLAALAAEPLEGAAPSLFAALAEGEQHGAEALHV